MVRIPGLVDDQRTSGETHRNHGGVIVGVLPASSIRQRLSRNGPSSTLRRRVRLPEVALGGALVVAGAVGSVLWATREPDQRILVAARDLRRGESVDSGTLRWAAVSGDRINGLTDPTALVGRILADDVVAGSPVVPGHFRPARAVAADEVGVGVSLERGMYPPDLADGDEVQLVVTRTGEPAGGAAETEVLAATARVYRIEANDASMDGRVVVGLIVKQEAVVAIASAERIHLVRSDLGGLRG